MTARTLQELGDFEARLTQIETFVADKEPVVFRVATYMYAKEANEHLIPASAERWLTELTGQGGHLIDVYWCRMDSYWCRVEFDVDEMTAAIMMQKDAQRCSQTMP